MARVGEGGGFCHDCNRLGSTRGLHLLTCFLPTELVITSYFVKEIGAFEFSITGAMFPD